MRNIWLWLCLLMGTVFSQSGHVFFYNSGKLSTPVYIAGSFTNWEKIPMIYREDSGGYRYEENLKPGVHEYRFVVNGRYFRDPENPHYGGVGSNSIIYIPGDEPVIKRIFPPDGTTISDSSFQVRIIFQSSSKLDFTKSQLTINKHSYPFQPESDTSAISEIITDSEPFLKYSVHLVNNKGKHNIPNYGAWYLKVKNHQPHAEAGFLRKGYTNEPLQLSGLQSTDPDYDPLTEFDWHILAENGRYTTLTSLKAAEPVVTFHQPGIYYATLRVNDGQEWSTVDTTINWILPQVKPNVTFIIPDSIIGGQNISSISLVGEFNRWKSNINKFYKNKNIWRIDTILDNGIYEYKIVVNDSLWIPDPTANQFIEDGYQGKNSIKIVNARKNILLPEIVFEKNKLIVQKPEQIDSLVICSDPNNPQALPFTISGNEITFPPHITPGNYLFYVWCTSGNKSSYIIDFQLTVTPDSHMVFNQIDISPSWLDSAIIYEVFVPQFSKHNISGKFRDILENISYFKALGINTLWFMPVYPSPNDHNYTPTEFFDVDPELGSLAEFKTLINDLHANGIKVIFDFVGNHSGDQHPFFRSAWNNPDSYFRSFYKFHALRSYEYHNDWDQLPNLNYDHTNVRQYMLEVADFWVHQGIDGFRCDAAWGVPHSFWKHLRKKIKQINPQFLLLNEVLPRDPEFHKDEFDMSYNTDLYGNILDFLNGKKSWIPIQLNFMKDQFNFPPGSSFLNYLENHDMPRFAETFDEDSYRLFSALLLLSPGVPMLYHGQEVGIKGMRSKFYPAADRMNNKKLYNYHHALIQLRKKILSNGGALTLVRDKEVLIFKNNKFLICFNLVNSAKTLQYDHLLVLNKNDVSLRKINIAPDGVLTFSELKPAKEIIIPPNGYIIIEW